MPRPTLPTELKNISMMDIVLTQHSEEDVWKFYEGVWEKLQKIDRIVRAARERWISKVFDRNPYEDHNWRKGKPTRLDKNDWVRYMSEEEMEIYYELRGFKKDLHLCDKVFKWSESEVKQIEFNEMVFDTERFFLTVSNNSEFELYETFKFNQAKTKWETDDAEWITEKKEYKKHKSHHRPKGWKEEKWKTMDEEERRWYERGTVDWEFHEECKFCVKEDEDKVRREREEKEVEERDAQKLKESNERFMREKQEAEQKQIEVLSRISTVNHVCDLCSFHTTSKYIFDEHTRSKSHIAIKNLKDWHCSVCDTQCRTINEWNAHNSSRKHKVKAGMVEKDVDYCCKKCEYSTKLKQNFQKHLLTQGHIKLHS